MTNSLPTGPASPDRREALTILGASAAFLAAGAARAQPEAAAKQPPEGTPRINVRMPAGAVTIKIYDEDKREFVLPPLPYAKAALEPHIDAQTMEIHHGKHHQAYVNGLNKALKELATIREAAGDAALVKHWAREVAFHAGGHVNHALFWHMMAPAGQGGGGEPTGPLADALSRDFGSFPKFVAQFKATAAGVDGSGWAWLVHEPLSDRLFITPMEKQQDGFVAGCHPILGLDVWEHAYYLKYQNKRPDYATAFFNVVNWSFCQQLYTAARGA